MKTFEKLILKNMGIAFGILSLSGTQPEIHPPNCNEGFFENTTAILGLR